MLTSAAERNERTKAIRQLMEKWKKNVDIRKKAVLVLQMNPAIKTSKMSGFLIP